MNSVLRAHKSLLLAGLGAAMFMAMGMQAVPVQAETLSDALAAAYNSNPTIRAARAGQRATDETVPAAKSGWRPVVTASGQAGQQRFDAKGASSVDSDPASVTIQLTQPIFTGFRTTNAVAAAEAGVKAGQAQLSATEQSILLRAVAAYMDVVRDRRIVALRNEDVKVLNEQLNAANARFKVGEITRTDVAQARASLSQSETALALAKAQLAASESSYEQIIGSAPKSVGNPGLPKGLPGNLQQALSVASDSSPQLQAAAHAEQAARSQIGVARSGLLPQASLVASYTALNKDSSSTGTEATRQAYYGQISVPLYEGGEVYAGVREAKQAASQRRLQVIEAERGVRQGVVAAWNNYVAAGEAIASSNEQVKASQLALEGVRQEAMVGSRTTLDVLNAQSELVSAQIRLAQTEHDRIVGAYQVLAQIGKLTPADIGLGVENYDPAANYRRTRNKFIGTGVTEID